MCGDLKLDLIREDIYYSESESPRPLANALILQKICIVFDEKCDFDNIPFLYNIIVFLIIV